MNRGFHEQAAAGAGPIAARLGITSDEVSPDLETALRFAREFGLGWVEIRSLRRQYATDASLEDIREARELIDSFDIKVSVLDTVLHRCALPGTKLRKPTRDDHPYAEQDALLDRA